MSNRKLAEVTFEEVLVDLLNLLKGLPVVVIGGVAASLLGRPRYTQDIDVLVWLEVEKWSDLIGSLDRFGFVPRIDDALNFAKKNRVLLIKHANSGVEVDISFGALPFEEECISRLKKVKFGKLILPIPSPEDFIIMKAVAHRPRDIEDIRMVVEVHPKIDKKRVRSWVRQFADILETPEIWDDLERVLKG